MMFAKSAPEKSGRSTGQNGEIDIVGKRLISGVNRKNFFPALDVSPVDDDLPVKPPRTKKRRVKNIRTVRSGHDDDTAVRLKAVHLDQKLVQRLFTLVVSAAQSGTSLASDGVQLVDEHDARRVFLRRVKQVAYT